MLTACFHSDDTMRSRSVSNVVLSGVVDVPMPSARLVADWERETSSHMQLDAGDVDVMPLWRARARWPDYARCVQAMSDWTGTLGLSDVLAGSEVALMASRGARYHHDAAQYGAAAFGNLFISEDQGFDLYFPVLDRRIPLARGTVVVFDTGQPHGVIRRGSREFDAAHFTSNADCVQIFLTWELPIEHAQVARALQIAFDVAPALAAHADHEQLLLNGAPASVCATSGRWRAVD